MIRNLKLFIDIIHEIFYVLSKEKKLQLLYVAVIILVAALFELLGISAVLPFVQAVIAPDELMNSFLGRLIFRTLGISNSTNAFLFLGIGLILIYLLKNLFIIYARYVQASFAASLQKSLALDMLNSFLVRPYEFFLNTNSSVIRRACNNSSNSFYNVIDALLGMVTEIVSVFFIGAYLIYTDWITAVGTIIIMGIVLIGMVVLFKPAIKSAGNINKEMAFEKSKSLSQVVEGIKDIFVTKREKLFVDSFEKAAEGLRKSTLVYSALNACPDRITEGICISGIIGIICYRLLSGDEEIIIFIPKLATFAMAAFRILPSVGKITNRINTIVYNRPLQQEVYQNIRDGEKYSCINDYLLSNGSCDSASIYEDSFEIRFENVTWKYENQVNPVFEGMNIYIKKGESIGFVGPSGAGKTTAADILLGLLKPQQGHVYINNTDIFMIPYAWAEMVGYVPQSVYLIDDTIRANVAFGISNVSDEDVWDALERAQLKEFVETLPDGIDTYVGERGVKLSGGQRQRIAIARALFAKPEILVLDEATAALDNETEKAVMESIEALQGTVTMIIVAHRLSTIRNCDRVYEIKNGKATEADKKFLLSGENNAGKTKEDH